MRHEGYIVFMLNHLAARGCLFLFVRTHHHLGYYFNLSDTRDAANQSGALNFSAPPRLAEVVEIHRISQPAIS
jgi:hypothetical protein